MRLSDSTIKKIVDDIKAINPTDAVVQALEFDSSALDAVVSVLSIPHISTIEPGRPVWHIFGVRSDTTIEYTGREVSTNGIIGMYKECIKFTAWVDQYQAEADTPGHAALKAYYQFKLHNQPKK